MSEVLKGKPLADDDPKLRAMEAYILSTRTGKAMRTTAMDRDASALMGVDIDRTIMITFLIGSGLAGAAGTIHGLYYGNTNFQLGFQSGLKAFTAAVLGNTSNYWIGRWIGPRVFHFPDSPFFSKATLEKAHGFYERHGAITVMASRFLPLIRTFAAFVAGVGAMSHTKFQFYSILGGGLWVLCFVLAGYFFGQIPIVKNNLPLVIVGVIFVSFLPLAVEFARTKLAKKN